MRVLILDRSLGNSYTFGLASGLRKQGLEVSVAGPSHWPSAGVLPFYRRNTPAGDAQLAKVADSILGIGRAALYAVAGRPNILHLQWPAANDIMLAGTVIAVSRARIVLTLHNPISRHPTERDRFQRIALRMARQIIVHGPSMRAQLLESHPSIESKVNCIELGNYEHVITRFASGEARARLDLPEGKPVYAFVGNVRRRKGIEVFIRALAICRKEGIDAYGVIAGAVNDFSYLTELRGLGSSLSVQSSLHWEVDRAPLAQEHLDMVVSAADQVVLPFLGASQSASVVYAMTHGACVVTSEVGELPRTVEGRGLLVAPGSPESLAGAMRLAVNNPDLCNEYGLRAREYALTELSWERVASDTHSVYAHALES